MPTDLKTQTPPKPETQSGPDAAVPETTVLRQDLAVQKDLYLRLAADFENFKRRSRQDLESRITAQKDAFLVELLPVLDNLERALASGAVRDTAQFQQGVEMTLKQLQQLLRQQGIESDDILGRPFDPHRHEALAQGRDPAQPDHAILTVLQRGYRRGERVIRPAKVTVNDLTTPHQADQTG